MNCLKELIEDRNLLTRRYLKRIETESPIAEKSYTHERMKPFKVGVLEESKNIKVLQYQVGYLNNQMCTETERVFNLMATKIKKRWQYLGRKNQERAELQSKFWRDIK